MNNRTSLEIANKIEETYKKAYKLGYERGQDVGYNEGYIAGLNYCNNLLQANLLKNKKREV